LSPLLLLSVLAASQLALAAPAGQSIRPGLWHIENKISSNDPGTDQTLSLLLQQAGNLPPEQRQMLARMAAQNGIEMPTIGADGGIGVSACITPEMAARQQIPTGQRGDCVSHNTAQPGGVKISFTCANPPSSGEGSLRFIGESDFSMTTNIVSSARGAPERVEVNSSGRWLGACPAAAR